MEEQISKVFIHRRYKFDEILKDFCEDEDINLNYKKVKDLENYLLFINGLRIQPYGQEIMSNNSYKEYYGTGINDFKIIENKKTFLTGNDCENHIAKQLINYKDFEDEEYLIREPRGKNNFPDYIDKEGYFYDCKSVRCKDGNYNLDGTDILIQIPNYNNGGGPRDTICNEILNKEGVYKGLAIFVYYNHTFIVDLKIMPLTYCLTVNNQGEFQIKSSGKNGEVKNSNVKISLPTALKKTELLSWEEKKLEVLNAVNKYFNK